MIDAAPANSLSTDKPAEAGELYVNFSAGSLDCVALSDGYLTSPLRSIAPEVPEEELIDFLAAHGQDVERRRTPISCLFVRQAEGPGILVDSGIGTLPGPTGQPIATAGRLGEALTAAGIDATAIEIILVSHIHPDHIGGLFDDVGQPLFPKAHYYVPEGEIAFWGGTPDLSGTMMPPPMRLDTIRAAQRFLELAADRIVSFAPGDEVISGVKSILLDGHTPGQVGFLFDGDSESLLYTADAAPHPFISVKRPDWRFSFDTDAPLAIATRRRLVDLMADNGWLTFTPHFPWPSVGKIVRQDGETKWLATVAPAALLQGDA